MLLEAGFDVVSTDASDKMLKSALEERWRRRKEPTFDQWGKSRIHCASSYTGITQACYIHIQSPYMWVLLANVMCIAKCLLN